MTTPLSPHSTVLSPTGIGSALGLGVVILLVVVIVILLIRKFLRGDPKEANEEWATVTPGTENASAFIAASMQGVIEKLRAQEKELARLHLLAQERAQESERLTEEVTRNMPTGLLLVNATGAIGSSNPAAEEALGCNSLKYHSYKEVLGEDSGLAQMLEACLREGKTFQRGEVEHLTAQGEVRRLGVTISPIFRGVRRVSQSRAGWADSSVAAGTETKANGALCLMSDLTELTALQKQIRWKENLAALGEMSAGIAHEFKNALATISGYAQMIRSESQSGETQELSAKILEQTRALAHVVTEFLRFAKPLEICYETVPMPAIVERIAEEIRESDILCTVSLEGVFVDLPGDEALIRQALINLTRNALEAARNDGKAPSVMIVGSIEELGGRKWQRICIADNGPGIPDTDLPKIFLPFYTTKSEGTGLGLAVVQKIALQHGGSIEARNRADRGAEFLLWLPLRQAPSPSLYPSEAARI